MIITFFGHSNFRKNTDVETRIMNFLEEYVGDKRADIYLGGYGNFDEFAYECCKKYRESHPGVSLVFVTPYLTPEYQKNYLADISKRYDSVIYPEIEKYPLRLAIVYRNRFMVDSADFVLAYVTHTWGGAYNTYKYAERKRKTIFNFADLK